MYPGGYGNYGGGYGGGYGGYGGYGGGYNTAYGGGYNTAYGGGYGMNPYQSAQMQQANMRRAYAAQTQQANMYRAQQENVRRYQDQYARHQRAYSEQADRARAQQERYMRRAQAAQAEQGERNRESTQNAWMHRRQPRGRVDPESLQSSEVDEPRSRRSSREEDLANRMCRLGLMSGGLGDRDDDFVRRSTRPRRGEDYIRSSSRREGPRRDRGYDSSGEEYESDASIYDRYSRRSRYGAEEPRREGRFRSGLSSMFGGRSGRY